ncbi:uncharacterized protein LOC6578657 [Drosophila mojavensis]|uniref:Uncharacterized protein n=1 Tax=Drosophila mojavensis TaxID=7230 RepID=B4KTD9_DROMO|nr:uncharacterized protein LOC6578657 [Drosophila mojavensis]EDW08500.2 uncharacterized protein Dmoj_GI19539 [Drosophila mojavensis]
MCAALLRNSIKCIHLRLNTTVLTKRNICTSALRCKWRNTSSADVERSLLKGDNLPANYQLIYRAPLEKYVTWAKNVSTLTVSLISLVAAYNLATTSMNFSNAVKKIDVGVLASTEADFYFFAVGFVLINMAIRIFVFKYPLRIYKSGDKYVAVYGSQWPVGIVKHYFQRGQIEEYKSVLNPWSHIIFKLGHRSSMLMIDYFKTPSEFHELFKEKEP